LSKLFRYLYDFDGSQGIKAKQDAKISSNAWPEPDQDHRGVWGWWVGVTNIDGVNVISFTYPNGDYNHPQFATGYVIAGEEPVPYKVGTGFTYNFNPSYGKGVYLAGEESLPCEFDTYFETYVAESTSVLNVGNMLINGNYNLEGYVIDWHLNSANNPVQFSTGAGLSGQGYYTYSHPFMGAEEGIPVQPGTWIPRIRFVVIDGLRYWATHDNGQCELPTIQVNAFDCAGGNITGDYSHRLSYNFTLETLENASQSFVFNLNDDGSVNYFAIRFVAYDIPDRLRVYYVSGSNETLMQDIAVGASQYISDNVDSGYPLTFIQNTTTGIQFALDLRGMSHSSGDHIKLVVDASYGYEETFLNTNWRIDMKCLTQQDFTCPTADVGIWNEPNDWAMTWNAVNCRYEVTFTRGGLLNTAGTDFNKYTTDGLGTAGSMVGHTTLTPTLNFSRLTTYTNTTTTTSGNCIQLDDWIYIDKIGTELTITFPTESSYELIKNKYNSLITNTNWTNYSSDPLSNLHYKYMRFAFWRMQEFCGDEFDTELTIYTHYEATWNFDDINYEINIDLVEKTYGFVAGECESAFTASFLNSANSFYNSSNASWQTKSLWRGENILSILYHTQIIQQTTDTTFFRRYQKVRNLNTLCQESLEYCESFTIYDYFYIFNYRILITDPEDPINNFEVWQYLNTETGCLLPANERYLLHKVDSSTTQLPTTTSI
jgi:hypothetical protein